MVLEAMSVSEAVMVLCGAMVQVGEILEGWERGVGVVAVVWRGDGEGVRGGRVARWRERARRWAVVSTRRIRGVGEGWM